MKKLLAGLLACLSLALCAGPVHVQVDAPAYPGRQVTLYRYMDLFTRRLEPLAKGFTDTAGRITLDAEVEGTQKALLLVGTTGADLWLRAGAYHLEMPPPAAGQVRSLSGTARVDPVFLELDPLDINALMGDLNARLDAFLAEKLATDQATAMEAVAKARDGSGAMAPDTTGAARDLYLYPTWDEARTDTFGRKLEKFYANVDDPWFRQNAAYGIAGLYLGPKTRDRDLFDRYLKDRPVLYDVPEYVRFFSAFFADHLLRFPFRSHTEALLRNLREGRTDSLKLLLARNDFLKDDRMNELVLITNLYDNHAHAQLDPDGILKVLLDVREHSIYPEHRAMAANMVWQLTAMKKGTRLPWTGLADEQGRPVVADSLLRGNTCLMVTKVGNPFSDQELVALDQLMREYGDHVRFVQVVLDRTPDELARWRKANPSHGGIWLLPTDQRQLLDLWQIGSAPALYLLHNDTLTASPGPLPSQGLTAELHRIRVDMERQQRINRDRPPRAPKR